MTLSIEPTTGCDTCNDTGKAISGQLDPDGLWFKHAQCESCNGTGHAMCAAEGCDRIARNLIWIGSSGRSFACCGEHTHAKELVGKLMDGWL